MADQGGGAWAQLRAVPSEKAECFDSAGGVPCSDETAPSHGKYLPEQLPAAERHGAHPHRPQAPQKVAAKENRPREKRLVHGHKEDDHEEQQYGGWNMTMH